MSKKGGKKDKLKKFPRILDYLEVHYPNVYELIDDLACQGNLTPHRGGSITFLIPDSDYIKEIKKIAESDNPEKATDMIDSLILLDLFEKPADFADKKDNISTLLGTRLMVKSISPNKVVIEDGEITPDKNFKPFERHGNAKRGNMSVWHLTGRVKYEGAPPAAPKKPGKKGSAQSHPVHGGNETKLRELRMRILQEKVKCLLQDLKSADGHKYCPLLNAVTRLIRVFGDANDPTFWEEYKKAKCLLTMCPTIDFYLLFYNPLVFPYDKVCAAYDKGVDQANNVDTYRNFCNDYSSVPLGGDTALALTSAGINTLGMERDAVRLQITDKLSIHSAAKMTEVYKTLDNSNTLNGKGPVYPASLAGIFSSNSGLHLLIDEFCHLVYLGLQDVKAAPTPMEKSQRFGHLVDNIYQSYGDLTNPSKKTKLDKPESYGGLVDANGSLYQCVLHFWRTWALHMPCNAKQEFEERVVVGSNEAEDPYSGGLVDDDSEIHNELEKMDNSDHKLSEQTLSEMKSYLKSHKGQLPKELME